MEIDLTEEEVVELLYLAKAEAEKARKTADLLILNTNNKQAGFGQFDRAQMIDGLVSKLFSHVAWVADEDPREWEDEV